MVDKINKVLRNSQCKVSVSLWMVQYLDTIQYPSVADGKKKNEAMIYVSQTGRLLVGHTSLHGSYLTPCI